jgi:hypothetical protein
MPFSDIISPEKGHIWTVRGDPVNYRLFEAFPLSWSIEKFDSLCHSVDLYLFMQISVELYTNNCVGFEVSITYKSTKQFSPKLRAAALFDFGFIFGFFGGCRRLFGNFYTE